MCGEDGLPALSVHLAGSLSWSIAGGAEASSESHRRKPHKEIKDVIGRGRRKHCSSSSCSCSSASPASRISCTDPGLSRRTFRSFWLFSKSKSTSKPKVWKNTQRNQIKHDRKTMQRQCCCFVASRVSYCLSIREKYKRPNTALLPLCTLVHLKSLVNTVVFSSTY